MVENYENAEKQTQPNSFDVRLDREYITYQNEDDVIDIDKKQLIRSFTSDRLMLVPNGYKIKGNLKYLKQKYRVKEVIVGGLLGTTIETVKIPNGYVGQYQGRSSVGRAFIQSHQTAGWIDSGFNGQITLEITAHDKPVILKSGMRIGQLIVSESMKTDILYNGKYQNQKGVKPTMIYQDDYKIDVTELRKCVYVDKMNITQLAEHFNCKIGEIITLAYREKIDLINEDKFRGVNNGRK